MSFVLLPDWMQLRFGKGFFLKGVIYAVAAAVVSLDVALAALFIYAVRVI